MVVVGGENAGEWNDCLVMVQDDWMIIVKGKKLLGKRVVGCGLEILVLDSESWRDNALVRPQNFKVSVSWSI